LTAKVRPRASSERLQWDGTALNIWVHEAPADGAANAAVLRLVGKWLKVAPSRLTLVRGARSRIKVIETGDLLPPAQGNSLARGDGPGAKNGHPRVASNETSASLRQREGRRGAEGNNRAPG
jgi:uncharacterized protein YggU (UPF0235/DUF167 family)